MAFSLDSVREFIKKKKTTDKIDLITEVETFPKVKMEVSKEFRIFIESMGTIINHSDGNHYWVFESQLIKLELKK